MFYWESGLLQFRLIFWYDRKGANKGGWRSKNWGKFSLYGRFGAYNFGNDIFQRIRKILYGRKWAYKGGLNLNMDDISLFLGFFSVIFAVFSCEMGVKIFYMPLFKPKKGGLELGRGTSKSNRIINCIVYKIG